MFKRTLNFIFISFKLKKKSNYSKQTITSCRHRVYAKSLYANKTVQSLTEFNHETCTP